MTWKFPLGLVCCRKQWYWEVGAVSHYKKAQLGSLGGEQYGVVGWVFE